MRGKQPRLPFSSEMPSRVTYALGMVHYDVYVPFEVPSLGGNKYFVSFMDEFRRMSCVALLKFKHEVFAEFQKFKVKAGNQSGQSMV